MTTFCLFSSDTDFNRFGWFVFSVLYFQTVTSLYDNNTVNKAISRLKNQPNLICHSKAILNIKLYIHILIIGFLFAMIGELYW